MQPYAGYSEKVKSLKRLNLILNALKKKVPTKYLQIRDLPIISKKGWDIREHLKEQFKDVKYDYKHLPYDETLSKSSLVIITVNSTSFLETMHANFPTLLCFPLDKRIYNEKAYKLINILEKNNIFHHNAISLANHVDKVWPNVNDWWYSNEVQNSVKIFCESYAKPVNNKIIKLKKIIDQYI
tara:strand:- start:512 stop:1060 length:549 start_codon:yes stop_codon:yes gene_type:complete